MLNKICDIVYSRSTMNFKYKRKLQMNTIEKCVVIFIPRLHISWSEQKQTSFIFLFSRFTFRQPSEVLTPNSAARKSSVAEKHRRLDRSLYRSVSFCNKRSRVLLSDVRVSIKSTDFQHLPSHSSRVCCVKSNRARQS